MKELIKSLLKFLLPTSSYLTLEATYNRRYIQKLEKEQGYTDLNLKYEKELGRKVLTGPFKGLEYTQETSTRHITQRLLGCYESELHNVVNKCIQKQYESILDVGCAEGYYAVGLAMKANAKIVHAFDTDPWARKVCQSMANLNNVKDNLNIHGFCSPEWIQKNLKPNSLILSDCEGFEFVLFARDNIHLYKDCDLLIELHDKAPSMDHPIVQNLIETHRITIIPSIPHQPNDYPQINFLNDKEQTMCVDDRRQSWQGWVFMESKS